MSEQETDAARVEHDGCGGFEILRCQFNEPIFQHDDVHGHTTPAKNFKSNYSLEYILEDGFSPVPNKVRTQLTISNVGGESKAVAFLGEGQKCFSFHYKPGSDVYEYLLRAIYR